MLAALMARVMALMSWMSSGGGGASREFPEPTAAAAAPLIVRAFRDSTRRFSRIAPFHSTQPNNGLDFRGITVVLFDHRTPLSPTTTAEMAFSGGTGAIKMSFR